MPVGNALAHLFLPGQGPGRDGGLVDDSSTQRGGGGAMLASLIQMLGQGGGLQGMPQGGQPAPMPQAGDRFKMGGWGGRIRSARPSAAGSTVPYPGQFWRHGNVSWQAPFFSAAPSPGFSSFLNAMYGRFGQPSPAYQGFLQALQERRDARMGVPAVPPQGAGSPSAQRQNPSMLAGQRSF